MSSKKRVRSNSDESEVDSLEAKKLLLDILDESDPCTVTQDLDSFIKTFQKEISPPTELDSAESTESTESTRQELGFLFEASDDELGLPPTDTNTITKTSLETNELGDSVGLSELWRLDDQMGSLEYEFGYGDDVVNIGSGNNGEYVVLDGLFDYTDVGFGSPELLWQPETLPAQ